MDTPPPPPDPVAERLEAAAGIPLAYITRAGRSGPPGNTVIMSGDGVGDWHFAVGLDILGRHWVTAVDPFTFTWPTNPEPDLERGPM